MVTVALGSTTPSITRSVSVVTVVMLVLSGSVMVIPVGGGVEVSTSKVIVLVSVWPPGREHAMTTSFSPTGSGSEVNEKSCCCCVLS